MTSISEDPGACAVIKASASSSVKSNWSARTSVSESESLRLTRGSARSRRVARMTCSECGRASSPCTISRSSAAFSRWASSTTRICCGARSWPGPTSARAWRSDGSSPKPESERALTQRTARPVAATRATQPRNITLLPDPAGATSSVKGPALARSSRTSRRGRGTQLRGRSRDWILGTALLSPVLPLPGAVVMRPSCHQGWTSPSVHSGITPSNMANRALSQFSAAFSPEAGDVSGSRQRSL